MVSWSVAPGWPCLLQDPGERDRRGLQHLACTCRRVLTGMRLHMLQQVVVELELDPAGTARVGLCGEKENSRLKGRTNPNAFLLGRCGPPGSWAPRHAGGGALGAPHH